MKFVLSVYSHPEQQGSLSAYHFAKTVLANRYHISQIFFSQEGVLNSLRPLLFPMLNVPLLACSSALSDRNIARTELVKGFKSASLTQFFNALLKADRYVVFGN